MNYGNPWGAAAEQIKEKINFIFFLIVRNHKLELIDSADLSPSPVTGQRAYSEATSTFSSNKTKMAKQESVTAFHRISQENIIFIQIVNNHFLLSLYHCIINVCLCLFKHRQHNIQSIHPRYDTKFTFAIDATFIENSDLGSKHGCLSHCFQSLFLHIQT